MHPNLIEASEVDEIVVIWQGYSRLLANLETKEATKQDRRSKKQLLIQAEDMLGKSKHFTLNKMELFRYREQKTLSPPSDINAPNQVKVANVLPPGQK